MERVILGCLIITGLFLAGCAKPPTKEEFLAKEAKCLQCYCASNAVAAEAALIDCARSAQQCQKAGVTDILYNEVFPRLYGRLYLVERHLGHSAEAEQYLEKFAHFHAVSSTLARRTGRPHGEMERLIEEKFDHDLQAAWKTQGGTNAPGISP